MIIRRQGKGNRKQEKVSEKIQYHYVYHMSVEAEAGATLVIAQ